MDKIEIKGLQVYAHHGVYEQEQQLGQKFVVSAVLYLDLARAGRDDSLESTVNYGSAARQITKTLQRENYRLLERAAQVTAEELLYSWPLLDSVTVRLEKPWAPVGLPMDTVAAEITRGWHRACVALGSNMGDREGYLALALEQLGRVPGVRIRETSEWIETKAYGYTDQPDFVNGAVVLETLLSPLELLDSLQAIENMAGRTRTIHWGPRTLDLDLLFYDEEVMGTKRLILPHPEIEKRQFVLEPLVQIAPWLRHPVSRKTMRQLLDELQAKE